MTTVTMRQAAKDKLTAGDFPQEPELSWRIVSPQGIVGGLEFRKTVRVVSMQRDNSGENEIRGHCSPSTLSEGETDWSTDDPTYDSVLDLVSDYEAASNWDGTEDFDWRDAPVEPEEFHEELFRANQIDVDTDSKVSRETRAFQVAIDLGLRHGWNNSDPGSCFLPFSFLRVPSSQFSKKQDVTPFRAFFLNTAAGFFSLCGSLRTSWNCPFMPIV
jgi:hypothetical protein